MSLLSMAEGLLTQTGWMQPGDTFVQAVASLNDWLGLDRSRHLTHEAIEYLSAPRFCAVHDFLPEIEGASQDPRWLKTDIVWAVSGQLPAPFTRQAIQSGFDVWGAGVTPLRFRFSQNTSGADIVLTSGEIDGPSNILAWSELPVVPNRQLTQKYDSAEGWDTLIRALAVMRHEIGHALGLQHDPEGLMRAIYDPNVITPQPRDIQRIQGLYGPDSGGGTPTPSPTPTPGNPVIIQIYGAQKILIPGYKVTPAGQLVSNVFEETEAAPGRPKTRRK